MPVRHRFRGTHVKKDPSAGNVRNYKRLAKIISRQIGFDAGTPLEPSTLPIRTMATELQQYIVAKSIEFVLCGASRELDLNIEIGKGRSQNSEELRINKKFFFVTRTAQDPLSNFTHTFPIASALQMY